jgi:hypothetical protein
MSYIGRDLRTGAFRQLDDISSSFNSSTTGFTMQVNSTNVSLGDVNQILLSLGGVIQKPGTDFTISGSTLTFTTAPAANTSFFAILLGSDNGGTVTPTDVSVTKAKLADEIDIFAGTSLSAADLGAGVHIKSGDAGTVTASSQADDLVIENSSEGGMTIITPDDESARIRFTSPSTTADAGGASILYRQNINKLVLGTSQSGGVLDLRSGEDTSVINADAAGHVTMPKQSAFLANPSTNQLNFATSSNVQVEFGTERFDQNGDFASHTFTAPVTGRYQLSASLRIQSLDTAADYYQLRLATSNQTYSPVIEPKFSSDPLYWTLTLSLLVDMDANDTANVNVRQQSGTQQADIDSESYFSGFLAC